ncbi:MerR family transcriptional regulator [Nocardioides baekrokdamisoli]|uniref:MerR family transcriptional regulator n=1 Tax=Nocardioides baekrokdamisoli TaxID=1804624 RepID=A0A3G9IMP8_9ACTN|nr:MerR family transcriptional regulator [Nocardioides baekrokdamisoli]BBH17285.1 MerR family transcriptional regulator [Nocardioides baekrokdamisoli]
MTTGLYGHTPEPERDHAVYVISVAAELTGLHPQTLRTYERLGLITPGRTGGGGRRYSAHDIDVLRHIAALTSTGIGIEGVRRIMDLEHQVDALRTRVRELAAELEVTRQTVALTRASQTSAPASRLPVLRAPEPGQSVVVWRRNPS